MSAETEVQKSTKAEINSVSQPIAKPHVIGRVFCLLGKHDWSGHNENVCQRCGKVAVGLPKFENPPPPPEKFICCPSVEEVVVGAALDK